ncbi:MAG TPA: hypothetical protein VFX49_05585 [Chloroflexota bacterium]|nr:hypothetical protein [Chloroflexota bacterium]
MPEPTPSATAAELALLPYDEAAARIDTLLASLELHPDAAVRDGVAELLQLVDALHRTPLARLVALLETYAWDGGGASVPPLDRALADAVIARLLQLYDLAPLPADAAPPEPPSSGLITPEQLRATLPRVPAE